MCIVDERLNRQDINIERLCEALDNDNKNESVITVRGCVIKDPETCGYERNKEVMTVNDNATTLCGQDQTK